MSASSSFWDRRPWMGAALFASVMAGAAILIASIIEVRPHYRGAWRLRTDIHQGELTGVHPDDDRSRVRMWVRVRVSDEDGTGLPDVEVVLVDPRDGVVFSRGISRPPDGHVFMPVPDRFGKTLFAGELPVLALVPGATARETVPVPKRGEAIVALFTEGVRPVELHLRGSDPAETLPGRVWVVPAGESRDPRSAGIPLVDSKARLGAVPVDTPLQIDVEVQGYATSRIEVRVPPGGGIHPVVVPRSPRLATIEVRVDGASGDPLHIRIAGIREARPFLHVESAAPAGEGVLLTVPPAEVAAVDVEDRAAGIGFRSVRQPLEEGARWRIDAATSTPWEVLARGVARDSRGSPAAGVLVRTDHLDAEAIPPLPATLGSCVTDGAGRFEIRGPGPPGPVLLIAEAGDAAARGPVRKPPVETELTLGPSASLAWQTAEEPPAGALVVLTHPGMKPFHGLRSMPAARSGAFDGLAPGTYDLHLLVRGETAATAAGAETGNREQPARLSR